MSELSQDELLARSGVQREMLERLVDAGLIESAAGRFPETDVARIRLISSLVEAGSSVDAIARATASGAISFDFVQLLMPDPVDLVPFPSHGGDESTVEIEAAIRPILGGSREPHDPIREDDLAVVEVLRRAVELGAPLDRAVRITRSMALVAQKLVELQRDFVDEVLLKPVIERTGSPITALAETASDRYTYRALGRELIDALMERFVDDAIFDNLVQLTEVVLDAGGLPLADRSEAVVFIDVSEYTKRSEELGDAASAQQAVVLGDFALDLARRSGARLVKSLGDGAMLHAATTELAVDLALDAVAGAEAAGLWPLHAGVNCGPMIRRDGDYYGASVNLASRVADAATAGQVFVTESVVATWTGQGVRFEPRGVARLKNVGSPVPLFEAVRT